MKSQPDADAALSHMVLANRKQRSEIQAQLVLIQSLSLALFESATEPGVHDSGTQSVDRGGKLLVQASVTTAPHEPRFFGA